MKCDECNGSGKYVGLTTVATCAKCGGSGTLATYLDRIVKVDFGVEKCDATVANLGTQYNLATDTYAIDTNDLNRKCPVCSASWYAVFKRPTGLTASEYYCGHIFESKDGRCFTLCR